MLCFIMVLKILKRTHLEGLNFILNRQYIEFITILSEK